MKGCKGHPYEKDLKAVKELYRDDIQYDDLELQFKTLSNQLSGNVLLSDIITYLKELPAVTKTLFSEVITLVKLLLVMPATNASSERSFSALKCLKGYLRSTMTQLRLNNLLLLYVHRERLDKL